MKINIEITEAQHKAILNEFLSIQDMVATRANQAVKQLAKTTRQIDSDLANEANDEVVVLKSMLPSAQERNEQMIKMD